MITRQQIITEAREWIGTPYIHSQRVKGHGTDCVGLFWGITEALGMDIAKDLILQANYPQTVSGMLLIDTLAEYMDMFPAQSRLVGDLLVLKLGNIPTHVGILADEDQETIIHADNKRGVIESPLRFWKNRIRCCFRVRELYQP